MIVTLAASIDAQASVSVSPTRTWSETFTYSGSILAGSELVTVQQEQRQSTLSGRWVHLERCR